MLFFYLNLLNYTVNSIKKYIIVPNDLISENIRPKI